jgi:hypothetical protein
MSSRSERMPVMSVGIPCAASSAAVASRKRSSGRGAMSRSQKPSTSGATSGLTSRKGARSPRIIASTFSWSCRPRNGLSPAKSS